MNSRRWLESKWSLLLPTSVLLLGMLSCSLTTSEYAKKELLEDAVEMELPNYTIKELIDDGVWWDWHGDFSYRLIIEFDSLPSKSMIARIDSLANDSLSRWHRDADNHHYSFYADSYDGGRVPRYYEGKNDWYVGLTLSDNSTEAIIKYGHW